MDINWWYQYLKIHAFVLCRIILETNEHFVDVQERLWSYFNLADILPVWCYCIKKITFLPLCKYSPGGNDEQRNNGNNLWYRFNFSFYTLIQLQLMEFHGPLPQQWFIHVCVSGLESSVLYQFVKIHCKNTNLDNFNFQHSWVENKKKWLVPLLSDIQKKPHQYLYNIKER